MPIWKILHHPLFIALITLATGVLCASLYLSTARLRSSHLKVAELKAEVEQKAVGVAKLEQALETARLDSSQEKIYRDQLLMQKPGESVVQIPDLPPVENPITSTPSVKPPIQEWKELLFQ